MTGQSLFWALDTAWHIHWIAECLANKWLGTSLIVVDRRSCKSYDQQLWYNGLSGVLEVAWHHWITLTKKWRNDIVARQKSGWGFANLLKSMGDVHGSCSHGLRSTETSTSLTYPCPTHVVTGTARHSPDTCWTCQNTFPIFYDFSFTQTHCGYSRIRSRLLEHV